MTAPLADIQPLMQIGLPDELGTIKTGGIRKRIVVIEWYTYLTDGIAGSGTRQRIRTADALRTGTERPIRTQKDCQRLLFDQLGLLLAGHGVDNRPMPPNLIAHQDTYMRILCSTGQNDRAALWAGPLAEDQVAIAQAHRIQRQGIAGGRRNRTMIPAGTGVQDNTCQQG